MRDNNRSYSSVKTPLVIHCLMVKIKSTFGIKVIFQKFLPQNVLQGHRISAGCCAVHQNGEIGTERSVRLNARGCNCHLRNVQTDEALLKMGLLLDGCLLFK